MAQPAPRQHTASARQHANDARPSTSARPVTSILPGTHDRPRDRGYKHRQTEIAASGLSRHGRKGSWKHATHGTEALPARLNDDATRRRSPPSGRFGGRAWAVGNIGHNGRLYLRPVVRPGSERSQPPVAPFANAQPRRSLLVADSARTSRAFSGLDFGGYRSSYESPAAPARVRVRSSAISDHSLDGSPPQAGQIRRSHSFSTVDDHIFARAEAPGTLRVVISRAKSHRDRRRRNDSEDTGRLGVPIPSHRIGEPKFGPRGTPILRSSSQATNEHQHSDSLKSGHTSLIQAPRATYLPSVSRRHSEMSHAPAFVFRPSTNNPAVTSNPQLAVYIRERDFWAHADTFDHLENHPVDPALIIHADFKGPKKRRIIYATPLTLVAQITSSTNVDYDLLSDFFMTFRQFMSKQQLLEFLHDRFLWAVARQGNVSTAVRVRTFVAVRHWVLNYMVEDFVPDYHLRAEFCALINSLYDYLKDIGATGPKGLEQIAELKRCWRQYISLYFDDPYDEYASSSEPIQPGGVIHIEDADEDDHNTATSKWQAHTGRPAVESSKVTQPLPHTRSQTRTPDIQNIKHAQQPSGTTGVPGTGTSGATNSSSVLTPQPTLYNHNSHKSSLVWSCSIPFRPHHPLICGDEIALNKPAAPRTVALPSQLSSPQKANRPRQINQPAESYAEPLSEGRTAIETSLAAAAQNTLQPVSEGSTVSIIHSPGDLIRGRTLLPRAPDVEYQKDRPRFDVSEDLEKTPRGPGVRRVIGSIRRAVSSSRQLQGPALRHAHLERHGDQLSTVATTTRASEPSAVTSASTRSAHAPKSERVLGPLHPRTDLLGERALESFNRTLTAAPQASLADAAYVHEPFARAEQGGDHLMLPRPSAERGQSAANVTTGSRSIVIGHEGSRAPPSVVDSEMLMSGALQVPIVRQVEVDETASDMAGFQAPLDDDEPLEVATDDGWAAEEYSLASSPLSGPVHSLDATSRGTATNENRLQREIQARLGHQPSNSLDDPVLPDDPQPSRSLRRRNDRGNLRAAIPSFHERLAAAGPLPDALHSHPPSQPTSPALQPVEPPPPMPAPGVLGPTVEEQLKSMLFPDDPNEDGSPATALLKLEGRFVGRRQARTSFDLDLAPESPTSHDTHDKVRHRHEHVMDAQAPIHEPRPSVVFSQASTAVSPVHPAHRRNVSEASYNSIPLLERGLAGRPSPRRRSHLRLRDSDSSDSVGAGYRFPARTGQLRALNPDDASVADAHDISSAPGSVRGLTLEDMMGRSSAGVGQDANSMLERGALSFGTSREGRSFYDDRMSGSSDGATEAMFHTRRHPSTPPSAADERLNAYGVRISNGLPTPANSPPSPTRIPAKANFSAGVYVPTGRAFDEDEDEDEEPRPRQQPVMAAPRHSAFILRFRAERLAEAMTLVEQSALAQVSWRELIDLAWSRNGLEHVRSWADFVNSPSGAAVSSHSHEMPPAHAGPNTIDIVIARFNVVVKWAVSEILLTDDIFERVHCIQQYIRVAAACRKLRNFATMYQITTALISADLAGLRETWDLVPARDKAWLHEMETLVSPLKSFENVRKEQEAVMPGASGCIPFIGVYLNDLALKATRVPKFGMPASLADVDGGSHLLHEPTTAQASSQPLGNQPSKQGAEHRVSLINFERYQNAAAIVKTVLRLVEASKQYQLDVSPKLLSMCLWMCALGDEEIQARANVLSA